MCILDRVSVLRLLFFVMPPAVSAQHYIYDDGATRTTLILEDSLFSFVVFGPDGHSHAYGTVAERHGDTLFLDSWNDYPAYRFRASAGYVPDAAGADVRVCDASGTPIPGIYLTLVEAGARRSVYFPGKTAHTDLRHVDSVGVYGAFFRVSPGFTGTLTVATPFNATEGYPLHFPQERFVLAPDRHSVSPADRERFGNLCLHRQD